MDNRDELIQQLQETVRLLTLENDQLAERAEDTLLLGLLGEKINTTSQEDQVLEIALEQIALLKGFSIGICCMLEPDQVLVKKSFLSFSQEQWDGRSIASSPQLLDALAHGPSLVEPGACQEMGLDGLFDPAALDLTPVLLIPFWLQDEKAGFFLFVGPGVEGWMDNSLPLLERAVEMVVMRIDNLSLLRKFRELNDHLDRKVADRTQELLQSNQILQQEIAERKRVEAALHDRDAKLQKAQAIAQVGNWEIDLAKKTMWGSEEAFRVYGIDRTAPELPLEIPQSLVLPAYRPLLNESLRRLLAREAEYDVEFQICRLVDGETRFIHSKAELVVDENGRPVKVQGVIQDITQRKQAQEEIRHRLAELEAVSRISKALRVVQSFGEMVKSLLTETLDVLETDSGNIWLYNPDDNRLHPADARGWFAQLDELSIRPGEGVVGHVYAINDAYVTHEFATDPLTYAASRPLVPAGWGGAAIPIRTQDKVGGVLLVSVSLPRKLQPDEIHLLFTLAEIAGNAMHRMRLHEQTEQRLQRLVSLRAIDDAISSSRDLQVVLDVLLRQITRQLKVDAAAILLFKPALQMLSYAAGCGFRKQGIEHTRLRLGQGYAGQAVLNRRPIFKEISPDQDDFLRGELLAGEDFVAYVGVPLMAKEQIIGVLEIFHRRPLAPEPEWVGFLETLAGQATIAIENATLFDDLQSTNAELTAAYDATIEGWSRALDLRDRETEGHTQRVTRITMDLARSFGFQEADALAQIRWGALLHDIGKMGVPDKILLKPGPLTDDEWVIMRKHPVFAYDMLAPIRYLRAAVDIPYYHHEKWDGSGYPLGLKQEEIPLAARIFAVVDVWDALSSDRPYRSAWPQEKVIAHLRSLAGTHFDPQVVNTCLGCDILTRKPDPRK